MNRAIITASNTMGQLQKNLDIIGNNLSNINTNGYKRTEASFNDLLVQQYNNQTKPEEATANRQTPEGIRVGNGARITSTAMIMKQGAVKTTDRPLDVSFTKEGQYLQVLVDENNVQSVRYTRDGALYLSPSTDGSGQAMLVTADGNPVLDENEQPIYIPEQNNGISISASGQITVQGEQGTTLRTVNLGVIDVKKPQMLEGKGNNLYGLPANLDALNLTEADIFTSLVGDLRQTIAMQQGALEQSNVDMSKEMTDMMITQRSYQFNAKSINIADQMMGLVNGLR